VSMGLVAGAVLVLTVLVMYALPRRSHRLQPTR
jgi:hypothetical protein